MRLGEIRKLVEGTADAAFALAPDGQIAAWNGAATDLFGLNEREALGKSCNEVLHGVDECGRVCSENCTVRQRAMGRQPLKSYDIQVQTGGKRQWCNVSIIIIDEATSTDPYTLHIVRPSDMQKRFELLVRDFVVTETSLPSVNVSEILSNKKTPTAATDLTKREFEILQCLAKGETTRKIAEKLFISRATTNNHVQHIIKKLGAHSRLEAVRRAEQAGLI